LHYNWHRYYDPDIGRYLTPDPIGLAGGINPFVYVLNDPVNLVDPEGLLVLGFGGGASGGFGVAGDGTVAVISSGHDVGVMSTMGGSFGPQIAASAGPSVVVAPFANSVNNLSGGTIDLQLRLGFQATISFPTNGDLSGLVFTFDITPGWNIGAGLGASVTGIKDLFSNKEETPCP